MIDFVSIEDFYSSCVRRGHFFWHLWTPENHQVIFTGENDFKMGMNLIAIAALLHPDIRILTFELMSNHAHLTVYGPEDSIRSFFNTFKKFLRRWLERSNHYVDLSGFNCSLRQLNSPAEVRDVISYNNRNGFLVNPDTTPFSYRWGANRFFFNPDAVARFEKEAVKMTLRQRREIVHGRAADKIDSLMLLDGYACPLCFCDVKLAEKFYKNASNYLYGISRNIESSQRIAEECGERVFYSDDELFRIVCTLADKESKNTAPGLLPKDTKVEIARMLRFNYNADKKKIARMLKLDMGVLDSIFPAQNR